MSRHLACWFYQRSNFSSGGLPKRKNQQLGCYVPLSMTAIPPPDANNHGAPEASVKSAAARRGRPGDADDSGPEGSAIPYKGLGPIATPTRVYEVVSEALCGYIERAGLSPGDSLPSERALAQRLKVSRSSVRQAMTELRVMGLVEIRHGDGAYLRRPLEARVPAIEREVAENDPDYMPLVEARIAIERTLARLAAERRTENDLAALRAAIEEMGEQIRSGDIGLDGNRSFHAAVARAANNDVLCEFLASLGERIDRLSYVSLSRPRQAEFSLETHELIYEAIGNRDAAEAERLMADHLRITSAIEQMPAEQAPVTSGPSWAGQRGPARDESVG
jgi:GntR family transcriptional repressor for pyruvate dehydrogenase complex